MKNLSADHFAIDILKGKKEDLWIAAFFIYIFDIGLLQTLGKTGRVLKVYADGDLRVAVGNQTWTFNPMCVSQVPPSVITDLNNTMGHNEREDLQSKYK